MFLFIFGSMLGYVIEVFFRRFVSMKRWINPGFLKGPYLPIYGFGIVFFYVFSNINYLNPENQYAYIFNPIISIAIMGVLMTVLELIGGIVFINGMHIKLWDYSNMKGNYKGIICPLFSLIWTLCGVLFYFGVNPWLKYVVDFFEDNITIISFFVGIMVGLMTFDFIQSTKLTTRISRAAKENDFVINLEKYRIYLKDKVKESKEKRQVIHADSHTNLNEYIQKFKNDMNDRIYSRIYIDPEKAKEKKKKKNQE